VIDISTVEALLAAVTGLLTALTLVLADRRDHRLRQAGKRRSRHEDLDDDA